MLPLFALSFGDFTDALSDPDIMPKVKQAALAFVYLSIAVFVAFYLQAMLWMVTGDRQTTSLRYKYLTAALRQDITYFDVHASTGRQES
jgi:ATP-binding cassette subfamily B (MDR/TAP) protein 1